MPRSHSGFYLLLPLFLLSGCAALIYEIVWLQSLEFVVGATTVSIAVLLGTFMGRMCLGSWLLPRLVGVACKPLLVYAALEVLTALCGVLVPFCLPWVQRVYVANSAGSAELWLRALAAAALLLPPTMLMGATLPAVSRGLRGAPHRWGLLYSANVAGGVLGCLGAGFWLLRLFDTQVATGVAVGLNLLAAAGACVLARTTPAPVDEPVSAQATPRLARSVLFAIGLSGLTTLGAEVVWTRLIALTAGPTTYVFSIILATFLVGLSLGSATGSWLARRGGALHGLLGVAQALLIPAILWAGYVATQKLPYWDRNLSVKADPLNGFLFDLACCVAAILPATVLWGASFPLALATASGKGREAAGVVGAVYVANTLGSILGAVAFSVGLVPAWGSQQATRVLIAAAALAAGSMLLGKGKLLRLTVLAGAGLVAVWLVPAVPWQLLAFGRRMPMQVGPWKVLYSTEGRNSSIAYTEWVDKQRFFHVAGKVEASTSPFDMRLQRMLGHLPAVLHSRPRDVLIVGCGAGVTAGSFVVHPEVESITLCEIEPRIPPASARFFGRENHHVMGDRRTRLVSDDARHYVLTTRDRFDIITSDPIHPWVKGAAALYSKEYFELVRARLKPGGLVTQWVPLYESDFATVKSEIATFFAVFPHAAIWGNLDVFDQGYDLVLLGSDSPLHPNLDSVDARLAASPGLAASLQEVGFRSAADLLGMYAAQPSDLQGWLRDAQLNRDVNLRLQYLAGMSLNRALSGSIYGEIQKRSPFPEGLFVGSATRLEALKKVFDAWRTMPY